MNQLSHVHLTGLRRLNRFFLVIFLPGFMAISLTKTGFALYNQQWAIAIGSSGFFLCMLGLACHLLTVSVLLDYLNTIRKHYDASLG